VTVNACIEQIRIGRPVIIFDGADREAEGDIAFAATLCTPALVNLALTIARGVLCVSMPEDRARQLGVRRLPSNNSDKYLTPFGMPISLNDGKPSVSAVGRCNTILATCNASVQEDAFYMPGHVSTLIAHKDGLRARRGHTEGVLELLRVAGVQGNGVVCEILNESGEIADLAHLKRLSEKHAIPMMTIDDLQPWLSTPSVVRGMV